IWTIKDVGFELIGAGTKAEDKLVVHFAESESKPLVLNMVNSESIAELAGTEDFDRWARTQVQLFESRTEFQGKRVPCIRVQAPARGGLKKSQTTSPEPADDITAAMPTLTNDTF